MIDGHELLGYAYWLGIIAVVVWWIWGMKKASKPRKRSPREEVELASLRAAIDGDQDEVLRRLPPVQTPPARLSKD